MSIKKVQKIVCQIQEKHIKKFSVKNTKKYCVKQLVLKNHSVIKYKKIVLKNQKIFC